MALSGDGGDELFAGYNRYFWAERLARAVSLVPRPLRGASACGVACAGAGNLEQAVRTSCRPRGVRPLPGDKLHKIATLLDNPAPDAIYRRLVSQWERPDEVAAAGQEPHGPLWDATIAQDFPSFVPRMQFLDMVTYLPDDILTKVDRATMAVGLEGRVPLLDHRVVAYSWSLPLGFKVRARQRQMAVAPRARSLRAAAADRPAEDGLWRADRRLAARARCGTGRSSCSRRRGWRPMDFVRVEPVRRAWQEHLEGTRNWQYPLWTVLMLQAWRERWA